MVSVAFVWDLFEGYFASFMTDQIIVDVLCQIG